MSLLSSSFALPLVVHLQMIFYHFFQYGSFMVKNYLLGGEEDVINTFFRDLVGSVHQDWGLTIHIKVNKISLKS